MLSVSLIAAVLCCIMTFGCFALGNAGAVSPPDAVVRSYTLVITQAKFPGTSRNMFGTLWFWCSRFLADFCTCAAINGQTQIKNLLKIFTFCFKYGGTIGGIICKRFQTAFNIDFCSENRINYQVGFLLLLNQCTNGNNLLICVCFVYSRSSFCFSYFEKRALTN